MTGKYGRLTLLERSEDYVSPKGKKVQKWICRCDCGEEIEVLISSLRSGNTRSCGCLALEHRTTHGKSKTVEYQTWFNIQERVNNKDRHNFKNYYDKGITVCDRWLEPNGQGFLNFLEDMGERPSDKHSIDRIDNDGPYSPNNCRWATIEIQVLNKGLNKKNKSGKSGVTFNNKINKWCGDITYKGNREYLGSFEFKEQAIKAREEAELKYYGHIKE